MPCSIVSTAAWRSSIVSFVLRTDSDPRCAFSAIDVDAAASCSIVTDVSTTAVDCCAVAVAASFVARRSSSTACASWPPPERRRAIARAIDRVPPAPKSGEDDRCESEQRTAGHEPAAGERMRRARRASARRGTRRTAARMGARTDAAFDAVGARRNCAFRACSVVARLLGAASERPCVSSASRRPVRPLVRLRAARTRMRLRRARARRPSVPRKGTGRRRKPNAPPEEAEAPTRRHQHRRDGDAAGEDADARSRRARIREVGDHLCSPAVAVSGSSAHPRRGRLRDHPRDGLVSPRASRLRRRHRDPRRRGARARA